MESHPSSESTLRTPDAGELKAIADAMRGGGPLPAEMRKRFLAARSAMFRRGIFDPVLVRFDSITAPRASLQEIADQLDSIAAGLTVV